MGRDVGKSVRHKEYKLMPFKTRTLLLSLLVTVGLTGNAVAQTSPPRTDDKAPVAGANSFTQGQAKSRIEGAGFTQVTGLKKDDQGVWRGSAMRNGKQVPVSVDFRGNVVTP